MQVFSPLISFVSLVLFPDGNQKPYIRQQSPPGFCNQTGVPVPIPTCSGTAQKLLTDVFAPRAAKQGFKWRTAANIASSLLGKQGLGDCGSTLFCPV